MRARTKHKYLFSDRSAWIPGSIRSIRVCGVIVALGVAIALDPVARVLADDSDDGAGRPVEVIVSPKLSPLKDGPDSPVGKVAPPDRGVVDVIMSPNATHPTIAPPAVSAPSSAAPVPAPLATGDTATMAMTRQSQSNAPSVDPAVRSAPDDAGTDNEAPPPKSKRHVPAHHRVAHPVPVAATATTPAQMPAPSAMPVDPGTDQEPAAQSAPDPTTLPPNPSEAADSQPPPAPPEAPATTSALPSQAPGDSDTSQQPVVEDNAGSPIRYFINQVESDFPLPDWARHLPAGVAVIVLVGATILFGLVFAALRQSRHEYE